MPDIIDPLSEELPEEKHPLWRRLAWMIGIWAGSVAVLGAVAYGIRWWLGLG